MSGQFRFSFGPWNIHEGADPFGPAVRGSIAFNKKLYFYKELGFGAVQFHDDDAVPDMNSLAPDQIIKKATAVRKTLEKHGLVAEFVAPRMWEDPRTIDGGYTSNDAGVRKYAREHPEKLKQQMKSYFNLSDAQMAELFK
jgi:xylose isomerase